MAYNWLETSESGPHNCVAPSSAVRELRRTGEGHDGEALSIDTDEMMAILAETEPEHSHATDDMTIELNVVFNIMTDVERSDVSWRNPPSASSACEFD